jgi:hypothetical protein
LLLLTATVPGARVVAEGRSFVGDMSKAFGALKEARPEVLAPVDIAAPALGGALTARFW